ncbi:hypothetical protein ACQKDB_15770 [Planococcus kocurii]|uniref:hypothetical protein n=1 Tax=Planococcus kocurii TaxID=1374 RepID=UPI003D04FDD5
MTVKTSKALQKKKEMQEKIDKMNKEIKSLEIKSQQEIGKFILKEWEIDDNVDSDILFKIIRSYSEDVKRRLSGNEFEEEKGKQEESETHQTL